MGRMEVASLPAVGELRKAAKSNVGVMLNQCEEGRKNVSFAGREF